MATNPTSSFAESTGIVPVAAEPLFERAGFKTRFAMAILFLISLLCCAIDVQLYFGVVDQNVPGFPNSGQFKLLILFPFTLAAINVVLFILSKWLPAILLVLYMPVQFLSYLALFFYSGGGI